MGLVYYRGLLHPFLSRFCDFRLFQVSNLKPLSFAALAVACSAADSSSLVRGLYQSVREGLSLKAKVHTSKLGFFGPEVIRDLVAGGRLVQGYEFDEEFRLADLLFPAKWDYLERKRDYRVLLGLNVTVDSSLFVSCKLFLSETKKDLAKHDDYRSLVAADIVESCEFKSRESH